jgi:hypothetical protein
MRKRILLAVLLGCAAVAAAPLAWSVILRHEHLGPLSVSVRSTTSTVMQGTLGHADLLFVNNSAVATVIVEVLGEVRFSGGTTMSLPRVQLRLDPGAREIGNYDYNVGALGPATVFTAARVLEIHQFGTVVVPNEPTGCWDSDGFIVI